MALNTWAALARATPGAVWLARDEPGPADDLAGRFRTAIARQEGGEPFQYAVNLVGFRLLDLYVDHRVLIPRSDSEGLVDEVLAFGRRRGKGRRWGVAADIGTGSGALALSLAHEGTFERVIATDISADALEVARANLAAVAPATPVELRLGALLEPLGDMVVDVIISNPPYVRADDWPGLAPLVRDFEPRVAFVGGADGLDVSRALLREARHHLAPGGLLALEIDSSAGEAIGAIARSCGWHDGRVERDAAGRDRYFLATMEHA